jgi:hypothetical protein
MSSILEPQLGLILTGFANSLTRTQSHGLRLIINNNTHSSNYKQIFGANFNFKSANVVCMSLYFARRRQVDKYGTLANATHIIYLLY